MFYEQKCTLPPEGLEIIQSQLQQTCEFFIFETQVFEVYKKPIVAIYHSEVEWDFWFVNFLW